MDQPSSDRWKWIAAGFALVISYGVGYDSGASDAKRNSLPELAYSSDSPLYSNVPSGEPSSEAGTSGLDDEGTSDVAEESEAEDETSALAEADRGTYPTLSAPESGVADYASIADEDAIEATGAEASSAIASAVTEADTSASGEVEPGAAVANDPASAFANTYVSPTQAYVPHARIVGCAENGSCYGDISSQTGRPKTVSVGGYFRKDGTYVRGHYRSRPRR